MGRKRQMKFPKPCIECGTLSLDNRCPTHQQALNERQAIRRTIVKQTTGQYSGNYQRLAKIIRQTTIICAICGDGARHNDPWQADHINPSTPVETLDQLQGVHASCNRTKSNKPTQK
jgi:5-methylcytosine-specific restriction endonuclease McrA